MKKYICDLKNHDYLPHRRFKQIGDHILIELTEQQYQDCKLKIEINEEKVFKVGGLLSETQLLSLGGDYQKVISQYKKIRLQGFDGTGTTGGIMDTGNDNYFNHYTGTTDEFYNYTGSPNADSFAGKHGSLTSSIIKSPQVGMANGCRMVSAKVFSDAGAIQESWVLSAIAQFRSSGVHFFNMSLTLGSSAAISTALLNAYNNNCMPIAACGNSTTDSITLYPAGAAGVLAVNSIDKNGNAYHRNWQVGFDHGVDISCSGINSEVVSDGVVTQSAGTSLSSPFATAVMLCEKQRLGTTDNKRVIDYVLNKALKHADPAVRRVITY